MNNLDEASKGIVALIFVAFTGSIMGIFARELAAELNVVEQVFLRSLMGCVALAVVCRRHLNMSKITMAPRKEIQLIIARSLSIYVIAISLGTIAFVNGKYGPVAIVMSVPTTAILSVIMFGEKASLKEIAFVICAFLGAVITISSSYYDELEIGWPLICALVATCFLSFGLLGQKKQSELFNSFEIAIMMLAIAAAFMAIASGAYIVWSGRFPTLSFYILFVGFVSGIANVAFLLASNFGMQRVKGVVANNMLSLQPVFATIIGVFLYSEVLTSMEWLGGSILLASVILIARTKN